MELRIAPTTKANWKAALTQLPAAEARIFVYDCKREGKVSGLEAKKNRFVAAQPSTRSRIPTCLKLCFSAENVRLKINGMLCCCVSEAW